MGAEGTETIARDGAHALVRKFRLTVDEGPDAGRSILATSERTVIGSHEGADLLLHDATVSRFHCELVVDDAQVTVRDLESRNGTRVSGVSIVAAHLEDGMRLELGRSIVRFEAVSERTKIALYPHASFGTMLGASHAMRAAFALLDRAARSDATVLLSGETGVGKDVAAESIHQEGGRRDGPFVVVDCGGLPENLLESELFGHERGAFTGAIATRQGAFERAHGGTVFLDELGELPLALQPKLLRVLETRQVRRVGGDELRTLDVRVIAATNRDLRREVNAARFRADLFFRLAVLEIRIPPLRERREDLPTLVDHLIGASRAMGGDAPRGGDALRTPESLRELARHAWPGNVRELRNHVERSLVQESRAELAPSTDSGELPPVDISRPLRVARELFVLAFERKYLEQLLAKNGDNVSAAAREAGMTRVHFHRLLSRCGLR